MYKINVALNLCLKHKPPEFTLGQFFHFQAGYVTGLLALSKSFPPTRFRNGWLIEMDLSSGGSVGFLHLLVQLLASSSLSMDLLAYHETLQLISNLFAGKRGFMKYFDVHPDVSGHALRESELAKQQKSDKWPLLVNPALAVVASDLLMHCLR